MGKINWILILQGWAILWVVIGHAPLLPVVTNDSPLAVDLLYKFAYSFHMPLFVFISGYLFWMTRIERYMPYTDMLKEKFIRLGIPYVVFTIVAMVVKDIFATEMVRPAEFTLKEFVQAILYPGNGPLSELWFIATILWFFAMRPLWMVKGAWQYVLLIVLILCNMVPYMQTSNLLCYQNVMEYAIWFYLGVLSRKYNVVDVLSKQSVGIMLLAVVCGLLLDLIPNVETNYAVTIAICSISIVLAHIADRYIPWCLSSMRRYSYQIYLIGLFAQIAVKILYKHSYIPNYAVAYVMCILAGVYIPVLVSKIVEKLNSKILKLCIGLK